MKKILSSLFILILFFVLAWGVAGWYFGKNAETELKTYLSKMEQVPGEKPFRANLLSYETTLFGAKAKIKISSDISFLNERLGDFEINATMLNGPLFFKNENRRLASNDFFEIGSTLWKISIDELSVEQGKREYLNSHFISGLPYMTVLTDFEKKAYYKSNVRTDYGDALLTGIYNLNNDENEGNLIIENLKYKTSSTLFTASDAKISYQHQQEITAAYKPGTTHITIPQLKIINDVLKNPVVIGFNADAAIQSEESKLTAQPNSGEVLNGLVKITLDNLSKRKLMDEQLPIEEVNLNLQFNRIPASSLIMISEKKAQEDNLYQQIEWTIEESAELPEGRDHIRQLNDRLELLQATFHETIANSLLVTKSQIRLNMMAKKEGKESSLKGKIGLNKETGIPENILGLLKGEAQVKLTKDVFEFLKPLVPIENQSFKLSLQQGRVLLSD